MAIESSSERYFVGPLNIDRKTKQAETVMGTMLSFDSNEFDVLEMLAAHEGVPLAFDEIYKTVWETGAGLGRSMARSRINSLVNRINAAGEGFMWVDCSPGDEFTFQIRWGSKDWKNHSKPVNILASSKKKVKINTAHILIGTAVAGLTLLFVFLFSPEILQNNDLGDYIYIFDGAVPLAELPELENNIVFPSVVSVTTCLNEVIIEIYNPEVNTYLFIFELLHKDTGEIISTFEVSAPGSFVKSFEPTNPYIGHEAILNIRAYEPVSHAASVSIVVTFPPGCESLE